MPRRPRVDLPHSYFHVTARGNNRQPIFDDELRRLFLERAFEIARREGWIVLAYALMLNHFHLVLQTGERGLSTGMRDLDHWLACVSNTRFGRIDHCLGRRFWSAHLDSDAYLLASIRYACWNPVRAGMGKRPEDSRWTSLRASIGLDQPPPVLRVDDLLEHFSHNREVARDAFSGYVLAGHVRCQAPWDGPPST